jgi:hypothetical protein
MPEYTLHLAKPRSLEKAGLGVPFSLSRPKDHAMTGFSILAAKPVTQF